MTPKEKRDRLFRNGRPFIRLLESKDIGWLWVAYKSGSFKLPEDLTQEEFTQHIGIALRGATHYLVEDENKKFQSGKGPVALVSVMGLDKKEPLVAIFKWASKKNILRGFVAFWQWIRNTKDGANYETRMPAKDKLFKRLVDYGVVAVDRVEMVYRAKARK